MTVSVVIPVRDDAERLAVCLDALSRQTFSGELEIVVVDNGSACTPADVVARHANARLLEESRPSSYAARNTGAAAARGDVLAFTDSDCVPAPDWVERGCAHATAGERPVFVGGRVVVRPRDPAAPTVAEAYDLLHAFPQETYVRTLHFSTTANLFVTRAAFDLVGPFDHELVSSGDWEWGRRAHAKGVEPVYADDVVVSHPARRSWAEAYAKACRIQLGRLQVRGRRWAVPIALGRLVTPSPFGPVLRNLSRVSPPTSRARLEYAVFAVSLHYASAFARLRLAVGAALGRRALYR